MPELNRIAQGSWVFSNVLVNATWTRPSVASLFTGLLPEEHGAIDRMDVLPPQRVTLAELLAERGYDTAAFVSNYVREPDRGKLSGEEPACVRPWPGQTRDTDPRRRS
jgi:arylsulfatase A-like enzyme